ncbi:MAG: Mfa1 family fimbria major subunit [Bacteroidales bacterium]|nr:Mfa1 family fimbria major subunit [Bacteroidales bacterium]
MKKNFFFMAALLVAMTGCNKEPQMENNGISSDDKVYMSFSIQTLTTRSATDSTEGDDYASSDADPDVEVGLAKENKISSVDIVLRNANRYVCATVTNPTQGENNQTWVAEFNSAMLATNTEYEVYIYANCSAKQDVHATSGATITEMTADNKFWMTNAYEPATVKFQSYSTDKANPTDLGTYYVERAMARFDYMPKGPYTLGDGVEVTLTEAALINQSREFYMLRRVSADGTNSNWTVGGVETPNNYVVDVDYADKKEGYRATCSTRFENHMTDPNKWVWKSIAAADLTQKDNWNGKEDGVTGSGQDHTLNEYYVWQYCKENTIPGADIQENGISTGIVFKGQLSGALVTAAAGKTIYVFDNILYGTWDKVVEAAAQDNASEAFKFAVSVCNDNGKAKDAATLAAAGFTGFSADTDGNYYTYYYYWNRHNDNGNNTAMGKMEFAVVRNNVYKLCVDEIGKYGHPTPGGDDPDPDKPTPEDPDEEGEYYFKVTVKVLPWVVRVNHIEF